MSKFYKPYQEEFYAVNILLPIDKKDWPGEPTLGLMSVDYTNRCYNYNAITPDRRTFNENFMKNVVESLKDNKTAIEAFINTGFPPLRSGKYIEIIKQQNQIDKPGEDHQADLHYHLADLYHSFPSNPKMYFDGIMRKIETQLAKEKTRIKYATIDYYDWQGDHHDEFPCVIMSFFSEEDWPIQIKLDDGNFACEVVASQISLKVFSVMDAHCTGEENCSNDIDRKIFDRFLFRLFSDKTFNGVYKKGDGNALQSAINKESSFIVMPIYSADFPEGDFGTVIGHFYLVFKKKNERDEFCKNDKLSNLWQTWTTLTLKTLLEGRAHLVTNQEFRFNDILKDLLSKITFVQDWERVLVFSKHSERDLQYCFKRFKGGKDGKQLPYEEVWDICDGKNQCSGCLPEQLSKKVKEMMGNDSTSAIVTCGEADSRCFYLQSMKGLLDLRILPSIEEADIARYKHNILCFEFPKYTFLPIETCDDQDEAIKKLGEHYINKLIPIFDKLLLKKKVLKHSTKAAVSAIISRNHSHHIGSHVTPRTSVKNIEKRLGDKELGCRLNEGDLLKVIGNLKSRLDEYVQKKADFMAEIATEPLTTTISKSFFREVLLYFIQNTLLMDNIGANEGVNYEKQNEIAQNRLRIHFLVDNSEIKVAFQTAKDCSCITKPHFTNLNLPYTGLCPCHKPIELKGDENNEDVAIAWPGPLGEFALYCFLENLIRNAIKHNSSKFEDSSLPLNIYVSINNLNDGKNQHDFYEIEVWEDVSNPCELKSVIIDEEDKNLLLWKYMDTLTSESIVENDGSLRRGAWGIAEMQIMATLMRGSVDFTSMKSNLTVKCCPKQEKGSTNPTFAF